MIILIGLGATLATFLGGLFALRFRDQLHLILGFSAGALLGAAFFDLLPESLGLAGSHFTTAEVTSVVALGFLAYLLLDRFILLHRHGEEHCENHHHRGQTGAGSLSLHSLLDGIAVGLAFQVSSAVGLVVTAAVLTHDFSDGINTVSLILKNGGNRASALRWLAIDAIAPFIGVISTFFFTLPAATLSLVLALFTGFFLYLGASDLLPESHHAHPTRWTTLATVLGLVVIYSAIKLAGI